MKFDTFCIVAGSEACTGRCKWCVASMTPAQSIGRGKVSPVDDRVFRMACDMAKGSDLDTARITGKGEPTIFPDQITRYLELLQPHNFSFVELQTHGLHLAEEDRVSADQMLRWSELGMTHVCISIVSYDASRNHKHYFPQRKGYYDLPALIEKLHAMRFNVRLTCIMQKGDIDCVDEVKRLMEWAAQIDADQVTILPVNKPSDKNIRSRKVYDAAVASLLTDEQLDGIRDYVTREGVLLRTLPWGAQVFDIAGQNLCFNMCLTHTTTDVDASRQLIFYPPGTIGYDWEHAGAVLYRLPATATISSKG